MSLALNPPAPIRRGSSAKGCIKCTGILLLICFAAFVAWVLSIFVATFTDKILHPHKSLLQNQTWVNISDVVRPLIDQDRDFDVAASVWIKMLPDEEAEYKRLHPLGDPQPPYYKPLYSDIAFKNLRLTDKQAITKINFTLPTEIFRASNLSAFDLRGTLVLIPSSPSPLDYLTNYSYWMPAQITATNWPRRAWPFPLGSHFTREQNLGEQAMDLAALVVPLVSFHEVPSRCKESDISFDDLLNSDNLTEEAAEHLENLQRLMQLADTLGIVGRHKKHPHIISRTHIRMIDDTSVFNLRAFNKAHNDLKSTSCGQRLGLSPSRNYCQRPGYFQEGPLEMRLQLSIPDSQGDNHTEWLYSPYWDIYEHSAGPKDQIPVPVNRENCTEWNDISTGIGFIEDSESMNITWHLSFAGRTPAKYLLSQFGSPHSVNNSHSEYEKAMAQGSAEMWNGIRGQVFEDAKPRRRALLSFFSQLVVFAELLLFFFYWYTLPSTVGVSVSGAKLILLSCASVVVQAAWLQERTEFWGWFWGIFASLFGFSPFVLVVTKAIFRVQVGWRWKWVPTFTMLKPTHRERLSQRVDQRTGLAFKAVLVIVLTALFWLTNARGMHLISPLHPSLPPSDSGFVEQGLDNLFQALDVSHSILQIIMNQRSRTFAGSYKLFAYLLVASSTMVALEFIPSFIGRHDTRPGLYYPSVLEALIAICSAWQAMAFPSVKPIVDEDED